MINDFTEILNDMMIAAVAAVEGSTVQNSLGLS